MWTDSVKVFRGAGADELPRGFKRSVPIPPRKHDTMSRAGLDQGLEWGIMGNDTWHYALNIKPTQLAFKIPHRKNFQVICFAFRKAKAAARWTDAWSFWSTLLPWKLPAVSRCPWRYWKRGTNTKYHRGRQEQFIAVQYTYELTKDVRYEPKKKILILIR